MFFPATEKHVRKYSEQKMHFIMETPEMYQEHIRPYMERMRDPSRLQWMRNIIEQKAEVDDVILRSQHTDSRGFVLLPDLNWDRSTMSSLHLLVIVDCNDVWSLRDLKKKDIPWLWDLRAEVTAATLRAYPSLQVDQLKFYVHYLPTYFHFHIHVVHVLLDSGSTQAVGKAIALESIISQLQTMGGDEDAGMDSVLLTYSIGEEDTMWSDVLEPLVQDKSSEGSDGNNSKIA
jgi:m7GpppX diphosphatase